MSAAMGGMNDVFFFFFVRLGMAILHHVEGGILRCTVVEIILAHFCAMLIYVLCVLEENPLDDSDFFLALSF